MQKKKNRSEFVRLVLFLTVVALLVANGFLGRIAAQENQVDVFKEIVPIADAIDKVRKNYVEEPQLDKMVEGALYGVMLSLDPHSSYVSAEDFTRMKEDTEGAFPGIGVVIRIDKKTREILVWDLVPGQPAAKAGLRRNDVIQAIDGVSLSELQPGIPTDMKLLEQTASRIRGARGTEVRLTILRRHEDGSEETLDFNVKRDRIPMPSIPESRILEGGIGYIRVSDFKKNTADEIAERIKKTQEEGMQSLVLDLRWNTGGLLGSAKDVAELFLPKNALVTSTKGRNTDGPNPTDNLKLYTQRNPVLPETFPMVILTNESTASASEIVSGALQYYARAIVVGAKTFGKGSVQTVIPLERPKGSALRLTTARYYTPAGISIDHEGIKPDVEVNMSPEDQEALLRQMWESYEVDADMRDQQNHGSITGAEPTKETVEDTQLKHAVELLKEDSVFENLVAKYHKNPSETQVEAKGEIDRRSPLDMMRDASLFPRIEEEPTEPPSDVDETPQEKKPPSSDEPKTENQGDAIDAP